MCLILGIGATTFLVVRIIPSSLLIGERERANLVVQLAQFFSICLSRCISRFYDFMQAFTTVNRSNFTYTVSCACANICRYAFELTGHTCTTAVLLACSHSPIIHLLV